MSFSFQVVPPAPGRASSSPGQNGAAHESVPAGEPEAGGDAAGQSSSGGLLGGPLMLFLFLGPLLLFMFLSTRSQQKKQKAALAGLKTGDRVLTQSGLVGRLSELGDRYVKIEIASGVKVEMLKTSLSGRDTVENATAVEKKK